MKIRQGFVSNSSSSSFIAATIKKNIKDISLNDFKDNHYMIKTNVCFDGNVYIHTNNFVEKDELYDMLQKDDTNLFEMPYIFRILEYTDNSEIDIKIDDFVDMVGKLTIIGGEKDNTNPISMTDIDMIRTYQR